MNHKQFIKARTSRNGFGMLEYDDGAAAGGLSWMEARVIESSERFIPRLLVDAGLYASTSDVKRQRPDLWVGLPDEGGEYTVMLQNQKKPWLMLTVHFIAK